MYDWQETVTFYRKQGAPGDQTALVNLLREIQDTHGHAIPGGLLPDLADALGTKESFLRAVIQRMPSLRLSSFISRTSLGSLTRHRKTASAATMIAATMPKNKV